MSEVHKIRPWGGDACNIRDLNPTGDAIPEVLDPHSISRYR